ncbi:MAG: LysM peptidoglycan-binding domain-containing protein [Prevotellaceae bacterium]|nr:LysM peptidoglycan-binding domain-containing protein [Prevotellaceae bacterium]
MKRIALFALLLWAFCSIAADTSAQNTRTANNNVQDDDIFYHTVERGQTVYAIAKMYEVKVEDIYRLNMGSNESIRAGDKLKIPQKKSGKASATDSESEGAYVYHTIQPRETLYGVSKQYGVSGENIVEANPGLSQERFSIGKTIRIPTGKKQKPATEIVENPKGAKEIYYTVPARETMYNICRIFKTTEKELLKLNPELAGGLRRGMTLRVPLRISENDIPKEQEPDAQEVNAMLRAKRETKLVNAPKVALLLPYNAANRRSANAAGNPITEYYEGLLLAVDSLRNMGHSTELFNYDIGDDISVLQKILREDGEKLKDVNLIIGGVSNEQIKMIADFAQSNKTKYVIPFTSRNDEVLSNAYTFQVNTPQNLLYANAVYAGANLFAKYNILFLDTKDKDDQTEFINEFKRDLKERNISYREAVYEASKFPESIEAMLSADKPNVIMPVSNSLDALLKIKTVLRSIAETKPEYKISLFGYPIWQTYTKDCLEDFHALDTYIYSLFYADNMNPSVKMFYEKYKNWFSKNPMSTFVKYGMLGFDTGMYFFGALQHYGTGFENNLSEIKYKSIQTGFNFERVNNWGGYINTNIYIIHYNKDFTITRSDFK